ncbi:MAG TPA: CerR family C-terminal domain-containing protein [Bryobacteraceae bacterium]|nr:CerR family C-terminal domain-containing protein [Bryobacteraceae bacterium]
MKQATAESKNAAATDVTRCKLLDAAAEVFAEVGFHRATVREICARAGVNGALVNYHFGDKLELYNEVLRRLLSAARIDAVRAALSQKAPPEDILRDVIKARLRGAVSRDQTGWLFRILAHEMAQPTPAMARIMKSVSQPIFNQLCDVVGALLGLPGDDAKTRLCAQSVMGQVILYVLAGPFLSRLWPELNVAPDQIDQIANHIADFSLAYLKGHSEQSARNGKPRHAVRSRSGNAPARNGR